MNLTDREKEQLKAMIDAGRPLPPPYKADLFDQSHEAELIWSAKTGEIANVVLPFQTIEQIKLLPDRVTQITHGRRGITGDTALRLGHWFGTSAQFWLTCKAPTTSALPRKRRAGNRAASDPAGRPR